MYSAPNQAIYRLNALLEVGYVLGTPGLSTGLSLTHPQAKFRYRHAFVYDDGQAVMPYAEKEEKRFFSDEDNRAFDEFISTVPKPTFLERLTVDELSGWLWGAALGAFLMHTYLR